MDSSLFFLKLGGSLITDKDRPYKARNQKLSALAKEIFLAWQTNPTLKLVIGHGSGSFGHVAGKEHHTREGVNNPQGWKGFVHVWEKARRLNQIVIDALQSAGLPVIAFPPSAGIIAHSGQVKTWDIQPIQAALEAKLIPVINGDVIFDEKIGGTILSTEELFFYLAPLLNPQRILLAGIERGVWENFPQKKHLIQNITTHTFANIATHLGGSASTDITGGMAGKVMAMLEIVKKQPGMEVLIFSGQKSGQVNKALSGEVPGTLIRYQ